MTQAYVDAVYETHTSLAVDLEVPEVTPAFRESRNSDYTGAPGYRAHRCRGKLIH